MEEKQSVWKEFQEHLMTGISYMIPVIVPAGIIMGIGIMIGQFIGVDANSAKLLTSGDPILKFIGWITQVAGAGMMGLMFPVFAAFVSYSICDKPGLAPGFIGGYLAKEMGSGFLGAIAIGIFAGYAVKFLNEHIKFSRTFRPVKNLFLVPVGGSILVIIASYFVIGPIGNILISAITAFIKMIGEFGAVIPAIGVGLATIVDKAVFKKAVFTDQMKTDGFACFLLGFMGISEGCIPFAIKDPLFMVPLNIIASGIGGAIAVALGTSAQTGVPAAIWGWPLAHNPVGWVIAVLVGSLIVCAGTLYRAKSLSEKTEK